MTLSTSAKQRLLSEAPALCEVIRVVHRRGWCDGTGGNFSTLLSREPYSLLMAPSGVDKGSLQPENLIVVDESGRVIHGDGQASAETRLHQTILATTQANAVLHTHSQAATLFSRFPTQPLIAETQTVCQNADPINEPHGSRDPQQPPPPTSCESDDSIQGESLSIQSSASLPPARVTNVTPSAGGLVHTLHNPSNPENNLYEPTKNKDLTPFPAFLGYIQINGLEMLKGLEGISSHESSIAIPVLENCQDMRLLSHSAGPHLAQAPHGLLIAGHGLYAWGGSLFQARRHLEILEFLLEQQWRTMLFSLLSKTTAFNA
jgi:ribulose-5-phosphate 4-epimerase/fuculose-1-phosphate aldolase